MGYVTHRDGRWYAVSYEGLDPLTGRDRRRWHRASDQAAARALADTLPSARPPSTRGMTVSRYLCTRWLPTRQDRLRPTTAFRYEQMIDSLTFGFGPEGQFRCTGVVRNHGTGQFRGPLASAKGPLT